MYTSQIFDKNQPKEIQVDNKLCLFTYIHVVAKKTFTHFSALLNGLEESFQFNNNTIGKEKKQTYTCRTRARQNNRKLFFHLPYPWKSFVAIVKFMHDLTLILCSDMYIVYSHLHAYKQLLFLFNSFSFSLFFCWFDCCGAFLTYVLLIIWIFWWCSTFGTMWEEFISRP